jgi:hypothetical protein
MADETGSRVSAVKPGTTRSDQEQRSADVKRLIELTGKINTGYADLAVWETEQADIAKRLSTVPVASVPAETQPIPPKAPPPQEGPLYRMDRQAIDKTVAYIRAKLEAGIYSITAAMLYRDEDYCYTEEAAVSRLRKVHKSGLLADLPAARWELKPTRLEFDRPVLHRANELNLAAPQQAGAH